MRSGSLLGNFSAAVRSNNYDSDNEVTVERSLTRYSTSPELLSVDRYSTITELRSHSGCYTKASVWDRGEIGSALSLKFSNGSRYEGEIKSSLRLRLSEIGRLKYKSLLPT